MAKPKAQQKAVNKSNGNKVRAELLRRGLKTSDLAKQIGVTSDSLTNFLCGNIFTKAMALRIEDALQMPVWSTAAEFAARQSTAEKQKACASAMARRICGHDAAFDNISGGLLPMLDKLCLSVVVARFDLTPQNPVWKSGEDMREPFIKDLEAAQAGALFDSSINCEGKYYVFYHTSDLATTLRVIQSRMESLRLLGHAVLFYIESKEGWRCMWPRSLAGELIKTDDP